jgi:hypothetical protein
MVSDYISFRFDFLSCCTFVEAKMYITSLLGVSRNHSLILNMKQQKHFLLIIILIFGFNSCRQSQKAERTSIKINDDYIPVFSDSVLLGSLEQAYTENLPDTLQQFFINWNEQIKPNTIEFIEQNETIKAVFESYKEFYKPFDLLQLGKWEWGNKLNSNCKYVAVQNKIFYSVISSENFDGADSETLYEDSIVNFRPPLLINKSKILYLTDEYNTSLNYFLGTESTELGNQNIMSPSRQKGESKKRYEMIRPFIPILHGHWGGYWHVESHPEVFTITFNKDLSLAIFDFRVGYQGGKAILTKDSNGWKIKESKATWIE